jgi:hypothetical protein
LVAPNARDYTPNGQVGGVTSLDAEAPWMHENAPAATAGAMPWHFADMVRTRFGGPSGNFEKWLILLEATAGIEPAYTDLQSAA